MMNVNGMSSRASSVKDRNIPISISSDEDTEDKIIKEAEDK